LKNLIWEVFLYPYTSLPKVRHLYYYQNLRFYLDNELTTLIYFYSLLFSPAVLIVALSYVKNFLKLIKGSYRILVVRYYRILDYYNKTGLHIETTLISIISILATHDVILVIQIVTVFSLLHKFIMSRMVRLFINRRVYWSRVYGIQGRNIILDATSEYFNPLDPLTNLLGKVDQEIITSDTVPAFKEMLSLLRNQRLVKSWVIEQKLVKEQEIMNKKNKSLLKNKTNSKLSVSDIEGKIRKLNKQYLVLKSRVSQLRKRKGKTLSYKAKKAQ